MTNLLINVNNIKGYGIKPSEYVDYGLATPEDVATFKSLLSSGYKSGTIKGLYKSGIDFAKYPDYGIDNAAGAEAVKSCLDNGYKADTIKSLHRSGVEPTKYGDYGISNATDAETVKSCLDNGYKAETIKSLHNSGINASDYSDYGISNATDTETVKGLLNKGIKTDTIKTLNGDGVKPSEYSKLRIVNQAKAVGTHNAWTEFLSATKSKYSSSTDAMTSFKDILINQNAWPEGYTPMKKTLSVGDTFEMALGSDQDTNEPGGWGTSDNITDVNYARFKLAIKVSFKDDIGKVVTYKVTKAFTVEEGTVGPQIDIDMGRYLPGGGNQLELPMDENQRMDYLDVVSVRTIS